MYFLLLLGGRDDTSKSVIVTLSNLWEGATAPPPLPPARYSPVSGCVAFPGVQGNVTLGKF